MILKELIELHESKVTYSVPKAFQRFRAKADSFENLKKSDEIKKYMGPHTTIIDVSDNERVSKAPGENKWNAIRALFSEDNDEIVCARTSANHDEWICAAINIEV